MPKKDVEKKKKWKRNIQNWLESGLNQKQWCTFNKESKDKLYYWKLDLIPHFRKNVKDIVLNSLPCTTLYLYSSPTYMQKGFEGLLQIVMEKHKDEITPKIFFAFVNRRCNKMKVLYWNENGLVIWSKRIERGTIDIEITKFASRNDGEFIRLI